MAAHQRFAAGKLIATYDPDGLHFYMTDPLGTRRAQTDYAGVLEQTCSSLPYRRQPRLHRLHPVSPPNTTSPAKNATPKSGNDYFGARYYSSAMGRFMSPDWANGADAVPYADFGNPQSLNLYGYVRNNPLAGVDADGHNYEGAFAMFDGIIPIGPTGQGENRPQRNRHRWTRKTPPRPNRINRKQGFWSKLGQALGLIKGPAVGAVLPPAANGAMQAAKQATKGLPRATTPQPPQTGPQTAPPEIAPRVAPGELPEIGPNATLQQKLAFAAAALVKILDSTTTDIIPPMYIPQSMRPPDPSNAADPRNPI